MRWTTLPLHCIPGLTFWVSVKESDSLVWVGMTDGAEGGAGGLAEDMDR